MAIVDRPEGSSILDQMKAPKTPKRVSIMDCAREANEELSPKKANHWTAPAPKVNQGHALVLSPKVPVSQRVNRGYAIVLASKAEEREKRTKEIQAKTTKIALTPCGETTVTPKEQALKQILEKRKNALVERLSRYEINANHTRVALDPSNMEMVGDLTSDLRTVGLKDMSELVPGFDLEPPSQECVDLGLDTALTDRHPLEVWTASTTERLELPHYFNAGLRLGFGFPPEFPVPTKRIGKRVDVAYQDRLFAARCGEYTLVGVVNGHGKPDIAEALAQEVAQLMPEVVFKSPLLARSHDPEAALTSAFHRVHCLASAKLSLELTGACCTVALVDNESIWVAHVGDCRAVLARPDEQPNARDFHYTPTVLTQDHKLSVDTEIARVHKAAGATWKLLNDSVSRLFIPNMEIPGLTLTRALGDRIGHAVGVEHLPVVRKFRRSELPQGVSSFLVLGSGGLWATISERLAVNWVSKHFDSAGDAATSLATEAFSRWQEPGCLAKGSLRPDLPDCFSTALLFFDLHPLGDATRDLPMQVSLRAVSPIDRTPHVRSILSVDKTRALEPASIGTGHPKFVPGPHIDKTSRKAWQDVCKQGRSIELRKVQGCIPHFLDLPC